MAESNVPLVSVIVPAYNAAHCISKALQSVLDQTEPRFEIIVLDDCSTDGTGNVVSAFQANDRRVRLVKMEKNGGQYVAMNHGFTLAMGGWICVLDADDWYHPARLETMIRLAAQYGVQVVADNLSFYDNVEGRVSRLAFPEVDEPIIIDTEKFLKRSNPLIYNRNDYGLLKPFFSKTILSDGYVRYCETRNGADYYFILTLIIKTGRMLLINDPLYFYVEPVGSISRKLSVSTRKPYPFFNFFETNSYFMDRYKEIINEEICAALKCRGEMFFELGRSEIIRRAFHDKSFGKMLLTFLKAPIRQTWVILVRLWHLIQFMKYRRQIL